MVDKGHDQRLVGKLISLSQTHHDIAFAVSVVSQFMHSPTEECLEAIYWILKYQKGAPGKGLLFGKRVIYELKPTLMLGRWNNKNRRSTYGYYTFVGGKDYGCLK